MATQDDTGDCVMTGMGTPHGPACNIDGKLMTHKYRGS
jgi:hypothetical protein